MFRCNNPDLTMVTFQTSLAITLLHKQMIDRPCFSSSNSYWKSYKLSEIQANSFPIFSQQEIFILFEHNLGHLRYCLADMPP